MNPNKKNIIILKNNIIELEKKYSRKPGSVRLLTVSKTRSIDEIKLAYEAGQHDFGENHVQEALNKIQALQNLDIVWHFIGPIQSNKTKAIAENFNWVHSIDRAKIAHRLNEQRPQHLPPLNICIEINVSNESNKSGVSWDELPNLANLVNELPQLNLRGLMAIPAITADFDKQRANFHKVATAFKQLQADGFNIDTLSMGMSADFEAAIAEGATIVRIGTAIFGPRNYINLQIAYDIGYIPSRKLLTRWTKTALPKNKIDAEITIRIVGETESQELNNKYRHKNKPTNVLSFPFEPLPHIDINLLGDLVICAPVVNKEAKEYSISEAEHWAHIVIHGILHLLGHEHSKTMEALEIDIMEELGFANPY